MSSNHSACCAVNTTVAVGALVCMASFSSSLHGGSTLEAGGHRVEVDVRPALGVHKLLPAEVKVPLIVLGDVAFGHQPRVVWMQPCVAHSHGQFLSVLAGDGAATRGGHLAPVVDVILLEQSGSPVVRLTPRADDTLDHLWSVLLEAHEVPELSPLRSPRQRQPESPDPVWKEAVVAQLDLVRAERAQPSLDLRERVVVVLLEEVEGIARHAMHVPGCVIVHLSEGEGVPVDEDVLIWALKLHLMGEQRATEVAALDQDTGEMAGGDMVVVGAVVHHRLPVDRLDPFQWTEGLHATIAPVKDRVQVPARITQIGFEAGGIRCPGREDNPRIRLNPRLNEAQGAPVECVVVCLRLPGDMLQRTVVGVRPTVVGAHEVPGIAIVAAHHAVAAVPAHVQERVQLALAVAREDHRVIAHVRMEKVVDPGHKAFVANHQHGTAEDLLRFLIVDGLVHEDASVDLTGLWVDDGVLLCGTHTSTSLVRTCLATRTWVERGRSLGYRVPRGSATEYVRGAWACRRASEVLITYAACDHQAGPPRLQASEEVDHGGIDFLGPFLLRPMTAAGKHDRLPEVRDELRQVGNELVHTTEGDYQVPVTSDIERRDGHACPGKGGEEFPVAVDIAIPVQAPAKAAARECPREELDVGFSEPCRQSPRLHEVAEEAAAP